LVQIHANIAEQIFSMGLFLLVHPVQSSVQLQR